MLLDKRLRSFREVSIEGPTQTFIGRNQDDYVSFIGTKVQQWMMKVFVSSLCQFTQHFHHLIRKRTSSDHAILRALELRSGNHFHGFSNLLRILNRLDAPADV